MTCPYVLVTPGMFIHICWRVHSKMRTVAQERTAGLAPLGGDLNFSVASVPYDLSPEASVERLQSLCITAFCPQPHSIE